MSFQKQKSFVLETVFRKWQMEGVSENSRHGA